MLTPDPAILYPLVCRITAPGGLVDLAELLPRRGGVTLQTVSAEDVRGFAQRSSAAFPLCPEEGEGADEAAPSPGGVNLKIQTENGAEFSLIRPLTKLRVGDTVQVAENYTDRHELRLWTNAVVQSPPTWTFLAHALGREFYNITLDLLIVGGNP